MTSALAVVVGIILILASWGAFVTVVGIVVVVIGLLVGLVTPVLHRLPRS